MKKIINVLIVLTILFIIGNSLQNGQSSGDLSGSIIEKLLFLNPFDDIETFHYFIRKCAHFTEYFIYGLLLAIAFKIQSIPKLLNIILLFLPFLDEFVQTFVPGRDGNLTDVLIDSLGIYSALIIVFIIFRIKINKSS